MVDALGFRFYWTTHSLNQQDLEYKLNDTGRSTGAFRK